MDNVSFSGIGFRRVFALFLHTMHRCFQSEGIRDFELIPDDNTSGVVLCTLLAKLTHVEIENWLDGGDDFWQETSFGPGEQAFIWGFVTTVDETILVLVVAMKVTEDRDSS